MNDFDKKYNIIDEPTPVNAPLTAKYRRYVTKILQKDCEIIYLLWQKKK